MNPYHIIVESSNKSFNHEGKGFEPVSCIHEYTLILIDFDGVKGRHIDIKLGKAYDSETDGLHADYINLIEKLIGLGEKDELLGEKINMILDEYAPRRFMTEEIKKNIDILKSTFKIDKIIQIQRKDDKNSVSGKLTDFTSETIERLIQDGYQDALSK